MLTHRACPARHSRSILLTGCLVTALALGGCGEKNTSGATQVAVKINADEISVHQVNRILEHLPPSSPEAFDISRQEVLDKLIDQQLAVQQAIDKKLDRTAETILAIEAAKREILARAHLEQLLAVLPKPSEDDAQKFFTNHPELFSQRRIYTLQELQVAGPLPEATTAALRKIVTTASSIDGIIAWLKPQSELKFANGESNVPAEQLPLEVVSQLHTMKDGQLALFETPQGISVIRIAASRSEPIDKSTALPQIQKFLENQGRQDAITRELKRLRDTARIEYFGEFDKIKSRKTEATDLNHTLEKGIADLK